MKRLGVLLLVACCAVSVQAAGKKTKSKAAPAPSPTPAQVSAPTNSGKAPEGLGKDDPMIVTSKTKFDFGEALIEGQMTAPQGFFLQGKNAQSLSQLVKLRADFRNELRNSKSAVQALAK